MGKLLTKNHYGLLIAISLVICFFRVPILAFFSLYQFTGVMNFIPFGVTVAAFFRIKTDNKYNPYLGRLAFSALVLLIIYLSSVFIFVRPQFFTTLRELTSTTIFLFFPLMIDKLFSKQELEKLIHSILPYIILIAFTLTLSEFLLLKFKIFDIDQISLYLINKTTTKPTRLITFMSLGAIAMLAITAYFCYLFDLTLKKYQNNQKIPVSDMILIVVSFTNILLSDSMTLILVAFLLAGISIIIFVRNTTKTYQFSLKTFCILILLVFIFYKISAYMFFTTSLRERYIGYFHNGELEIAKQVWFPKIYDCTLSTLITGFPVLKNINLNNGCSTGEFHSIFLAFHHGFLIQLPWLIFILTPVFYFFKNIKKVFSFPAYFYGAIAFALPMVHYSGAEIWGNNYIAALFILGLLKSDFITTKT